MLRLIWPLGGDDGQKIVKICLGNGEIKKKRGTTKKSFNWGSAKDVIRNRKNWKKNPKWDYYRNPTSTTLRL